MKLEVMTSRGVEIIDMADVPGSLDAALREVYLPQHLSPASDEVRCVIRKPQQ
jgi:hypothetical protein